jgi:hypothetical protein
MLWPAMDAAIGPDDRLQSPDRVLRLILDPAMVRRWHADPFGFLRPWNELPALFGSAPPATPPLDRHRLVTS